TALVTCLEGDPYSRESRKMYKALEKTTKAAYGDDEGFAKLQKSKAGGTQAGLFDVARWTYELVCAELCGANHYEMRGYLIALEPAEFKAWQEAKSR
ncbi:MAG: hypothetical protein ACYS22_12080, partial [Planctomycetota bacterium]